MTMPPAPKPVQASAVARAGTERRPPSSAAIGLSATIVIHGAPNETDKITSTTVATVQDDRVSTEGAAIRSCILGSCLCWAAACVIGGALDGLNMCLNEGGIGAWSARWCGARRQDAAGREKHGHRRSSLRVLVETNLPRSRSCREAAGMGAGL